MKKKLKDYIPYNEQEEHDKKILLRVIDEKNVLTRQNETGHFSVSTWIVNKDKTKVLMCYHNIYHSWSWLGGHVDGNEDFQSVALKEVKEESGLNNLKILDDIFSIEILTVDGHIKNNHYVSSHLHYNVTYLIEGDENEQLTIKEDENSNVKWFDLDEALKVSSEPWFVENIYTKLNNKLKEKYRV